jgi:hypothetical protein
MSVIVHQVAGAVEVEDIHRSYLVQVYIDQMEAFDADLDQMEVDIAQPLEVVLV